MNWIELTRDTRLERCTTQKCDGQPTWRLEANGVGSDYCSGCKERIEQADRAGNGARLAHQISRGTLFLRLPDPPRPSTELKEVEKQMIMTALLSAAPPSSNAGEGDREVRRWNDTTKLYEWQTVSAPPQPAPDALREALVKALIKIASMDLKGIRADDLGRAARIAADAISDCMGGMKQP